MKSGEKNQRITKLIAIIIFWILIISMIYGTLTCFHKYQKEKKEDFEGELTHSFNNGEIISSENIIIKCPSEKPDFYNPPDCFFVWFPKCDFNNNEEWDDQIFNPFFRTELVTPYVELFDNEIKLFEGEITDIHFNQPIELKSLLLVYAEYIIETYDFFSKRFGRELKGEVLLKEEAITESSSNIISELIIVDESSLMFTLLFRAFSYSNSSKLELQFNSLKIEINGNNFDIQNDTRLVVLNFGIFQTLFEVFGNYTHRIESTYTETLISFENSSLEMNETSGIIQNSHRQTISFENESLLIYDADKIDLNFGPNLDYTNSHFSLFVSTGYGYKKGEGIKKLITFEEVEASTCPLIQDQATQNFFLIIFSAILGFLFSESYRIIKDSHTKDQNKPIKGEKLKRSLNISKSLKRGRR